MAGNTHYVGRSVRIRASLYEHEVQFIAKRFGITLEDAAAAICAAGPMRRRIYDYLESRKASAEASKSA
jgi:hypothetical protein